MRKLKVGTRKSPLAMKQTQIVINLLMTHCPQLEIEIVGLSTKGDRLQQAPLTQIGGKGVFVRKSNTSCNKKRSILPYIA